MFDVRITITPKEETRCKGCNIPAEGAAWYRLMFRSLTTHQTDTIWLCLECGKNVGALLLRDQLLQPLGRVSL